MIASDANYFELFKLISLLGFLPDFYLVVIAGLRFATGSPIKLLLLLTLFILAGFDFVFYIDI